MNIRTKSEDGSMLLYVVIAMTILAGLSATVLRPVTDEYMNTFRTASWQEALLAAESGIDLATIQLRRTVTNPGAVWPTPWIAGLGGVMTQTAYYTHSGAGGNQMQVTVSVDAPPELVDPVSGWQYYRVRSTGTKFFSGSRRAGGDKRDNALRKYSLVKNRLTGDAVAQPSVSRRIEVIVRPSSAFPVALMSKSTTTITNHNVVVDSYDSSDATKSTNGQYDVNKRQKHGDVATNGTLISAGNAHIFGNVSTNGGTVTGVANITGQVRNDFYQDIPSVSAPSWETFTPALVSGNTNFVSSTVQGAARYKVSDISLSGQSKLRIQNPTGAARTYVEVWVTGNFSTSGSAEIILDRGVIASFYIAGNMDVGGNGISNGTSGDARPGNFLVYGLKPADGVTPTVKLAGNADVESALYAPDADVSIVGGGSRGDFSGSVVGKTIFLNGVTQVHYDEALNRTGTIVGYRIASWVEDGR